MQDVLWVGDTPFEVDKQKSQLYARLPGGPPFWHPPDRPCWSIDVFCVEKESGRSLPTPCMGAVDMPLGIRDWRAIEGRTVRDEKAGGTMGYFGFLLHEAAFTSDNSIRFVSRRENLFQVEWECLADVDWGDGSWSELPVRLSTEIAFTGVESYWIEADARGVATATELVERYFDRGCLQGPEGAGSSWIVFPPRLPDA